MVCHSSMTYITKRGAPEIEWFDTERWAPAWDAIDSGYSCNPEFLGGFRRTIEDMKFLITADATAGSRDGHFPEIHQELGEVQSMVIGPPRQSCMGALLGTLRCNAEIPGARNEARKLRVVTGALQYHREIYARSLEAVSELEGYEGLKADARRLFCARDFPDRFYAILHWVGAM